MAYRTTSSAFNDNRDYSMFDPLGVLFGGVAVIAGGYTLLKRSRNGAFNKTQFHTIDSPYTDIKQRIARNTKVIKDKFPRFKQSPAPSMPWEREMEELHRKSQEVITTHSRRLMKGTILERAANIDVKMKDVNGNFINYIQNQKGIPHLDTLADVARGDVKKTIDFKRINTQISDLKHTLKSTISDLGRTMSSAGDTRGLEELSTIMRKIPDLDAAAKESKAISDVLEELIRVGENVTSREAPNARNVSYKQSLVTKINSLTIQADKIRTSIIKQYDTGMELQTLKVKYNQAATAQGMTTVRDLNKAINEFKKMKGIARAGSNMTNTLVDDIMRKGDLARIKEEGDRKIGVVTAKAEGTDEARSAFVNALKKGRIRELQVDTSRGVNDEMKKRINLANRYGIPIRTSNLRRDMRIGGFDPLADVHVSLPFGKQQMGQLQSKLIRVASATDSSQRLSALVGNRKLDNTTAMPILNKFVASHRHALMDNMSPYHKGIFSRFPKVWENFGMPEFDSETVVRNVTKKYKEMFGLKNSDIQIGTKGGDIVLEFNGKKIMSNMFDLAESDLQRAKITNFSLRIPNFKGPLFVQHGQLHSGTSYYDIMKNVKKGMSSNQMRLIHFGEKIQGNLLDSKLLSMIKSTLESSATESGFKPEYARNVAHHSALFNDMIKNFNSAIFKQERAAGGAVERVLKNAKNVNNMSVAEALLQSTHAISPSLESRSQARFIKFLQTKINDLESALKIGNIDKLSSQYGVDIHMSKSAVTSMIVQAKKSIAKTIVAGENRLDEVMNLVNIMGDVDTIMASSRTASGKAAVKVLNIRQNIKNIIDIYSVTGVNVLSRGEVNVGNVAIYKRLFGAELAKTTKAAARPYTSAFAQEYGRLYKDRIDRLGDKAVGTNIMSNVDFNYKRGAGVSPKVWSIIDFGMTSTEGEMLITDRMANIGLYSEVNSNVKLNDSQQRMLFDVLYESGDDDMRRLAKDIRTQLYNKTHRVKPGQQPLLLMGAKRSDYKNVTLMRKVGHLLKDNGLLKSYEKDNAVDSFVRSIGVTGNGELKITYDSVYEPGLRSKIMMADHTKGIAHNFVPLSKEAVMKMAKSRGINVSLAEAGQVGVIYASKALASGRQAPIVNGIMESVIDSSITMLQRKHRNISPKTVKEIANSVVQAFVMAGSGDQQTPVKSKAKAGLSNFIKKVETGKTVFGMTETSLVMADDKFMYLDELMAGAGGKNIMESIQTRGKQVQLKNHLTATMTRAVKTLGVSKSQTKKLIDDVFKQIVGYDKAGHMQSLRIKMEAVLTRENPYELARVSERTNSAINVVKNGVRLGPHELMIMKTLGMDQMADYQASLHSLGKEYVGSYYGTLLEMSGYSRSDISSLFPDRYRVKRKVLKTEDIKMIKDAVKRGTNKELKDKFAFMQPAFNKADAANMMSGVKEKMMEVDPDFWDDFATTVDDDITRTLNETTIRGSLKSAIDSIKDETAASMILTEKQHSALKRFLYEYRELRLSGKHKQLPVPGLSNVNVDRIALPHHVLENVDSLSMKLPLKGNKFASNVYVPGKVLYPIIKMMRKFGEDHDYTKNMLVSDFTDYYNRLFNQSHKFMGRAIEMPGFQQIGLSQLSAESNAMNSIKDLIVSGKSRYGKPLSQSFSRSVPNEIAQYSPGLGEVLITKDKFKKIMDSAGMGGDHAEKMANEIIEGKRDFMMGMWRAPSLSHHSITPVHIKLIDRAMVHNKDIKKKLADAFILNGVDALSLSGDVDRDFYSVFTAITHDQSQAQTEMLSRSFKDYSYKIETLGDTVNKAAVEEAGGIIHQGKAYIPTGHRSRTLFQELNDRFKNMDEMAEMTGKKMSIKVQGRSMTKDRFIKELTEGYRLSPENIQKQVSRVLTSNDRKKRLGEFTQKAIGILRDELDTDRVDKFFVTSFEGSVTNAINDTLKFNREEIANAMTKMGVFNKDLLEDVGRKSLNAMGFNPSQTDSLIQAYKIQSKMNAEPMLALKALTGEIYNVTHNKVWTSAFDTFGYSDKWSRNQIRKVMSWGGVAQQLNISSKHHFPAVAPDIIKTLKDFANGDRIATAKLRSANWDLKVSDQLYKRMQETQSLLRGVDEKGRQFVQDITNRFRTESIGGKAIVKPGTIKMTEFKDFLKYRSKVISSSEELHINKILMKQADSVMKQTSVGDDLMALFEQMRPKMQKAFSKKGLLDLMMTRSYEMNASMLDARDAMANLTYGGKRLGLLGNFFRDVYAPDAKRYEEIPDSMRKLFTNKSASEIVFSRLDQRFGKFLDNAASRSKSENTKSAITNIRKAGRGGFGLALGSALVGFLAYQAMQPPADSWLGKTPGFGGEYYDRTMQKSDEHTAERSSLKETMKQLGTHGELILPPSMRSKPGRIRLEPLQGRYSTLGETLRGQYDGLTTLRYQNVGARTITPEEQVSTRIRRSIGR